MRRFQRIIDEIGYWATRNQLPGNENTFAYPVDVKPVAQWKLSSNIVEPSGSAVAKIKAVTAKLYQYNVLGNDFGFDQLEAEAGQNPTRIGLIAQELMAVEPSLVRTMDWLETDEEYYWIDYDALHVLCLDALNELNARADVLKTTLSMPITETYPTRAASTTQDPAPTNYQLTVTPTVGAEGTSSLWTLTATNATDGLRVGFKIEGTASAADITCTDEDVLYMANSADDLLIEENEGLDTDLEGWARGVFTFSGGQAQVTLNYTLDAEAEGPETIIMTLKDKDSRGNAVPTLSQTATITDA